ncbi:MAG: hypothetical protein ACT4NU_05905 [Chromatiales bacterium]
MTGEPELNCWKCGSVLKDVPLPMGRLQECPACRTDLHVCRMCEFYDPRVAKSCSEPIAEEVKDKERSNFCGYFKAKPGIARAREDDAAVKTRVQLDALFDTDGAGRQAGGARQAETDRAKEELERLFGSGGESGGKPH